MATTIILPSSASERNRILASDSIRRRALERLYERREAVQRLISALETYQQAREKRMAQCIDIAVIQKSPSDFAQSQI